METDLQQNMCAFCMILLINDKVAKQLIEENDTLIGQCAVLPVLAACHC